MKNIYTPVIAILVASVSSLSADDSYKPYQPAPRMQVNVEERSEWTPAPYVAVFGGANFSQWGEGTASAFGVSLGRNNVRSNVGFVGGVKVGAEFPGVLNLGEPAEGRDWLYPAIELDLFYNGFRQKANVSKADLDTFTFSVNPLLKSKIGRLKLYLGPGLGGTFIAADNVTTGITGYGQTDDLVLTIQGIGGTEFAITDRIGIFTEYKYVHWFDTDLSDNAVTVKYNNFGSHLINAGLKYSF